MANYETKNLLKHFCSFNRKPLKMSGENESSHHATASKRYKRLIINTFSANINTLPYGRLYHFFLICISLYISLYLFTLNKEKGFCHRVDNKRWQCNYAGNRKNRSSGTSDLTFIYSLKIPNIYLWRTFKPQSVMVKKSKQ